jgi:hypothetical protein
MKYIYGAALTLGLIFSTPSSANKLIEGFTKWQANRIERIAVDQALGDIAEDAYVKKFFTQTSQSIRFYDSLSGQRLIPLMQVYFKDDINKFDQVALCLKSEIKKGIQNRQLKPLNDIIEHTKTLIDKNNLMTTESFLTKTGCNGKDLKKASSISKTISTDDIESLKNTLRSLKGTPQSEIENIISVVTKLIALIEQIEKTIEVIEDDKNSYVIRAHQMLQILDLLGWTAERELDFKGYSLTAINRLKSISLFLAELADASDKDTGSADSVVAVLNQYVDEQDTYNRKHQISAYLGFARKAAPSSIEDDTKSYITSCTVWALLPCRDTLFLSSYYGLSIANIDEDGTGQKDWTGRAYGPVGIELKVANYRGSPITIGYAPIDIGNYVTAELKGDSYDAKTEDILSPSVFVSWSSASRPFSILVGYQKDIKIENGLTDDSMFLSFAFDLPIATIY